MTTRSFSDMDEYLKNIINQKMTFIVRRKSQLANMSDVFIRYELQGRGVAIVLNDNGTWFFEDTSGG